MDDHDLEQPPDHEQPPEGFNLDAERSREQDAAKAGIVAREVLDMPDEPEPVDADGSAESGDDDAIDEPEAVDA